jgi:hypothetical protein
MYTFFANIQPYKNHHGKLCYSLVVLPPDMKASLNHHNAIGFPSTQ